MVSKPQILFTKDLENVYKQSLSACGFIVESIPYINVKSSISEDDIVQMKALTLNEITVVFTSQNAIKFIAPIIKSYDFSWSAYCISGATQDALKHFLPQVKILGTANNAQSLAKIICDNNTVEDVIFFCGNLRRVDIRKALEKERISVNELEVYTTSLTPQKLLKRYDGYVFYSPSAVNSFLEENLLLQTDITFAIGETTSKALSSFSSNIVVSPEPNNEAMVNAIKEYYNYNK